MNQSLISLIKQLLSSLTPRRHFQFLLLLILTFITAFFEIISLGAILPFISVITQPDQVLEYSIVSYFAEIAGITSGAELVMPIALAFGSAALLSGIFRLLLLWGTLQLGNASGVDIGIEVYRRTLFQPYATHISRSSSEIISGITIKVGTAAGVLLSLVTFITSVLLCIAIISTLIAVDPFIAFVSASSFGSIYIMIALLTRRRLESNSSLIANEQSHVVKILQEGLSSIRDVLLDGSQKVYIKSYSEAAKKLKRGNTQNAFINQFPRFVLESLALILISIFVLSLTNVKGGISDSLPILAMLALGAQRLLPIVQQIYNNWSVVAGSRAALTDVLSLLQQPLPDEISSLSSKPLPLKESICFQNVSFRYSKKSPWIFNDINLSIPQGSVVGIIGNTGSGKSTAVDLMMSLLRPTNGTIVVDGQELNTDSLRSSWQRSIAHVPQSIYLVDATIAENIAFGVAPDKIDLNRVRDAATKAQISEFIESSSEQYNAIVGERGVRLSGGQRQRIGIARALYKKANFIIFDEATSALDDKTEANVMKTIDGLSKELTMIIIAHRLTTLKNCTHIIEFKEGKIIRIGNYQDLVTKHN